MSEIHPHERALVEAFFARARRARWLDGLARPKRRAKLLDRLNHLPVDDLDGRYVEELDGGVDLVATLRTRGALERCYVVSDLAELDGREFALDEAVEQAVSGGWGTLISCVPGRLALYLGESGERRLLLDRSPRS